MLITLPRETEVVEQHYVCEYHKANPGKTYAGCTCWSAYGIKAKSPAKKLRGKK